MEKEKDWGVWRAGAAVEDVGARGEGEAMDFDRGAGHGDNFFFWAEGGTRSFLASPFRGAFFLLRWIQLEEKELHWGDTWLPFYISNPLLLPSHPITITTFHPSLPFPLFQDHTNYLVVTYVQRFPGKKAFMMTKHPPPAHPKGGVTAPIS